MTLLVESMKGLGDNIYQRPFVRMLARREPVYITTPWPEIYEDLPNVHFVRSSTILRTQQKNIDSQRSTRWSSLPPHARVVQPGYSVAGFTRYGIVGALERQFGVTGEFVFDLPSPRVPIGLPERPIAVVRPVTERSEWQSNARSPLPAYIAEAAYILMETHHVVSVADVDGGNEWFVGEPPPCHKSYHGGELDVEDLIALVASASVVVGGVGWLVPMAIAAGTPLYCVLGGRGAHNAPEVITDPRMNLERVGWGRPDRYCMCDGATHACDKVISGFEGKFRRWLANVAS